MVIVGLPPAISNKPVFEIEIGLAQYATHSGLNLFFRPTCNVDALADKFITDPGY